MARIVLQTRRDRRSFDRGEAVQRAGGPMKIACVGWGSLVWSPADLPIVGGWRLNGPALPVEFTRQSKDGRMTLVITDGAKPVTVFWSELEATSPDEARKMLGAREGVPNANIPSSIGLWQSGASTADAVASVIADWAVAAKLEGVVWTALPPKFGVKTITPSADQVIAYLAALQGEPRRRAEEYIRRAPLQIATAYRQRIERTLGWISVA
ncbi:hypothetical protein ABIB00_004119 [Bradyrhizobium sp. LB14.3]|uniref:hypothetical protein n=1 Tax=Bradyrhizobium sp. LB14.3 TaxID=3156328 RepID=UPI0033969853